MELTEIKLRVVKEESLFRKIVYRTNWKLIVTTVCLTILGFIMIYSSTINTGKSLMFLSKQSIAWIIGIILMILFSIINYQIFQTYYMFTYITAVVMLIIVLILGTPFRGTRAWIDLKLFSFQPSEIVKILFLLSLSGYLDKDWTTNEKITKFLISMLMLGIILILILLEPDISAAVVYFPVTLSIFYLAGIKKNLLISLFIYIILTGTLFILKTLLSLSNLSLLPKWLNWIYLCLLGKGKEIFILAVTVTITFAFIWWILYNLKFNILLNHLILGILIINLSLFSVVASAKFIKPYQQKRFIAFINPNLDPTDAGYQVIQTRIAIGSGKILGKGLFKGTQTQLGFVPEKHTDFIFSLIAEELGFIGSLIVIILYFFIILEGINIMTTSRDTYGSLVACGITSMFVFYFFFNIGMCLGILPVIGIPLPFLSYGGSNLVSSFISVGILNSIHLRKFTY